MNLLPDSPPEDEINLLDLLIVLANYKKMILGVTLVAALLAVGYSLQLPNIYTSTAQILPPQQGQSSVSSMLGQLGGLAGLGGGVLGGRNSADMYVAMLNSRTLKEKLVPRFDSQLQQMYKTKTQTDALEVLGGISVFKVGKDGIISVEVNGLDPKFSADLANAFVEVLAKQMQDIAIDDAFQKRVFFEEQMKQAKGKLTDAEIHLDKTPNTSLHYLDAMRDMKYQEAIWEILAKQFESAKLEEAKNFPVIQVLDKAIPPERKSKPKRGLIVLLGALVAFFLAVIWAFVDENMQRSKGKPGQEERMQALRIALQFKG